MSTDLRKWHKAFQIRCVPSFCAPSPPSSPNRTAPGNLLARAPSALKALWVLAHIWHDRHQVYLGGFDSKEKAGKAHDVMAIKAKGTDSALNYEASVYAPLQDVLARLTEAQVIDLLRDACREDMQAGGRQANSSGTGVTAASGQGAPPGHQAATATAMPGMGGAALLSEPLAPRPPDASLSGSRESTQPQAHPTVARYGTTEGAQPVADAAGRGMLRRSARKPVMAAAGSARASGCGSGAASTRPSPSNSREARQGAGNEPTSRALRMLATVATIASAVVSDTSASDQKSPSQSPASGQPPADTRGVAGGGDTPPPAATLQGDGSRQPSQQCRSPLACGPTPQHTVAVPPPTSSNPHDAGKPQQSATVSRAAIASQTRHPSIAPSADRAEPGGPSPRQAAARSKPPEGVNTAPARREVVPPVRQLAATGPTAAPVVRKPGWQGWQVSASDAGSGAEPPPAPWMLRGAGRGGNPPAWREAVRLMSLNPRPPLASPSQGAAAVVSHPGGAQRAIRTRRTSGLGTKTTQSPLLMLASDSGSAMPRAVSQPSAATASVEPILAPPPPPFRRVQTRAIQAALADAPASAAGGRKQVRRSSDPSHLADASGDGAIDLAAAKRPAQRPRVPRGRTAFTIAAGGGAAHGRNPQSPAAGGRAIATTLLGGASSPPCRSKARTCLSGQPMSPFLSLPGPALLPCISPFRTGAPGLSWLSPCRVPPLDVFMSPYSPQAAPHAAQHLTPVTQACAVPSAQLVVSSPPASPRTMLAPSPRRPTGPPTVLPSLALPASLFLPQPSHWVPTPDEQAWPSGPPAGDAGELHNSGASSAWAHSVLRPWNLAPGSAGAALHAAPDAGDFDIDALLVTPEKARRRSEAVGASGGDVCHDAMHDPIGASFSASDVCGMDPWSPFSPALGSQEAGRAAAEATAWDTRPEAQAPNRDAVMGLHAASGGATVVAAAPCSGGDDDSGTASVLQHPGGGAGQLPWAWLVAQGARQPGSPALPLPLHEGLGSAGGDEMWTAPPSVSAVVNPGAGMGSAPLSDHPGGPSGGSLNYSCTLLFD